MRKFKYIMINAQFQLKVVGFFVTMFLIAGAIFFITINTFFDHFSSLGKNAGLSAGHIYFNFLSQQQHQLNLYLGISFLVILMIVVIGGLFLSHKVAGPLYRLCIDMRSNLNNGDFKNITFRKGDFFKELLPLINAYNEKLRSKKE